MSAASAAPRRANVVEPSAPKQMVTFDQSRTPHFTQELVEQFVKEYPYNNSYARYMFSETDEERAEWKPANGNNFGHNNKVVNSRSCHGYMHYTPILGGWISALRHTDQKDVNDPVTNEASLWYIKKFLLGKYSPWAALLPFLTIVYNQAKVPVAYIVDGTLEEKNKIDKHLLQNFNIASRWPREFPGNVQRMYDLCQSGLFKKTEALLLHNLVGYNTGTKSFTIYQGATVGGGHHFYQQPHCYRLLERKPNSAMVYGEGARFTNIRAAITADNDARVWGYAGRDTKIGSMLENMFAELGNSVGTRVITTFRAELTIITEEHVANFMKKFRATYEAELKNMKSEPTKPDPDLLGAVGTDHVDNYPGDDEYGEDDGYDNDDEDEDN